MCIYIHMCMYIYICRNHHPNGLIILSIRMSHFRYRVTDSGTSLRINVLLAYRLLLSGTCLSCK